MADKENTASVRITNKQIYEGLNELNKNLALHNQRLELHVEHESRKLIDHEERIRKIEESVWRSSWVTSVITAIVTAVILATIYSMSGL